MNNLEIEILKKYNNPTIGLTAESMAKEFNLSTDSTDFEDGLEYYAAKEVECNCIVTEDTDDFYFSEIEVLDCKGFFNRYLLD